jgi:MFS family permease
VPFGRLRDHGLRRTLLPAGLVGLVRASPVCSLAPNTWTLIAGRAIQGVAAGVIMPQVIGVIQREFHGAERGRAFGLFAARSANSASGAAMRWGSRLEALRSL